MTDTDAAADGRPMRRRDAVATRQSLLSAARTLMAERGVAGVSTREVAATAGVNQALVYRYFGSKDELFAEAARDSAMHSSDFFHNTPLPDIAPALLGSTRDDEAHATVARYLLAANDDVVREILRGRIQEYFGAILAARMPAPDAALRAELLAALVAGIGFLRDRIQTGELAAVDDTTLHAYVRRMIAPLLEPE
ncbi:TetR/AcrR family transcriptional regulator [Nocardia aurantia]|uniref:HTH-type transcriptional regulator BetI n=1 Tax=Nocardia aurantia TaxID=2585199 RepID=A0A7K0DSZ9_9NOCA|nr:TetR/AcrR family transcriptional regulator [Nocardia aurantia]MQY28881.1 HTH-type transcriptional regulator BetI [Nocardia aurantia]